MRGLLVTQGTNMSDIEKKKGMNKKPQAHLSKEVKKKLQETIKRWEEKWLKKGR